MVCPQAVAVLHDTGLATKSRLRPRRVFDGVERAAAPLARLLRCRCGFFLAPLSACFFRLFRLPKSQIVILKAAGSRAKDQAAPAELARAGNRAAAVPTEKRHRRFALRLKPRRPPRTDPRRARWRRRDRPQCRRPPTASCRDRISSAGCGVSRLQTGTRSAVRSRSTSATLSTSARSAFFVRRGCFVRGALAGVHGSRGEHMTTSANFSARLFAPAAC